MFKTFVTYSLFCLLALHCAFGLDEASAKEKRCQKIPPPVAKNVDMTWAASVKNWYFPYASRLDLYKNAHELYRTPLSEIKEHELYYDSCQMFKWEGAGASLLGFNGKRADFSFTPQPDGGIRFETSETKVGGTSYVTLTDSKTFQFFYNCYDDGEATWGVSTTVKSLDAKTVKKIHEHAKSLGFNEKNFGHLRYETC